jgi:hypothetical protein
MEISALLHEQFGRLPEHVQESVDGLDAERLVATVVPGTNSIGWLVWHLTRVQDHHVAELMDRSQIWVAEDLGPSFGVTSDPHNTGYGHTPADVAAIRPVDADLLLDYYAVVHARTDELLSTLTPDDLDRVVDARWDPPVTLGVRLASILDDDLQHAGQAKYLRGLLERQGG